MEAPVTDSPDSRWIARRRRRWPAAAILAAMIVAACFVWHGGESAEWRARFTHADWSLIAAAFGVTLLIPALAAYEWRLLIGSGRPLAKRALLRAAYVVAALQNVAHFVAGQGFALHHLTRKQKLPAASAISMLTVDQMADGIAKAVLFGSLFLLIVPPSWVLIGGVWVTAAMIVCFGGAVVFSYLGIDADASLAHRVSARGIVRRGLRVVAQIAAAFRQIRDWRVLTAAIAAAVARKLLFFVAALCTLAALGIDLPWQAAYLFTVAYNLAKMMPLLPGNLGMFEAVAWGAYTHFGASNETALLLGAVNHAVDWIALTLPGALMPFVDAAWPVPDVDQSPVAAVAFATTVESREEIKAVRRAA